MSSLMCTHILLPYLIVAQHESDTRKTISWSVIVLDKTLFNQYSVTAQIEPVQDTNQIRQLVTKHTINIFNGIQQI